MNYRDRTANINSKKYRAWLIALRLSSIFPAFFLGILFCTLFLGILPTLCLDAFVKDFHYTEPARAWVRYAGMFGGFIGVLVSAIWAIFYAPSQS